MHARWLTLADVAREHARSHPEAEAFVDGHLRASYARLDERVDRLAGALAARGVLAGDRVLWCGQNSAAVLELLLAAARLGAFCCIANWRWSAEELAFVLDDLEPAVVVWQDTEIGETVREARGRVGGAAQWIGHDEYEPLIAASDGVAELAVDPDTPVLVLYTAAFGGRPNGAMLSHTALLAQSTVIMRVAEIGADYRYLNAGPLFHMATLMTTLATFTAAGTNVFVRRVDPEELCRIIDEERCTGAFLVGPTVKQILEANRDRRYDLSSLRTFAGRGEWNEMVTIDTSPWARHPGGYGQTEVTGMLTFNTLGPDTVGDHGRPSELSTVRIVDPDEHEVAAGETGEITVRGPLVMCGYWNRPDENARRFRGGWYHTGDLGRRERDGSLTFVAPKTRVIKSAAENVYPAEVEACLASHPAVGECAVIGVPDPTWTQRVLAVVSLRSGETADPAALVEHCRSHIASYKKPSVVEIVDRLPRTASGMVDYDELDDRFGGGGYPGTDTVTDDG